MVCSRRNLVGSFCWPLYYIILLCRYTILPWWWCGWNSRPTRTTRNGLLLKSSSNSPSPSGMSKWILQRIPRDQTLWIKYKTVEELLKYYRYTWNSYALQYEYSSIIFLLVVVVDIRCYFKRFKVSSYKYNMHLFSNYIFIFIIKILHFIFIRV